MAGIIEADLVERALAWLLPAPVRSSAAVLVAANCVPLYGVLFWDWPVFYVMALYWAENVIAGFWTLARMLVANPLGSVFMGAFFTFHYGMFCAVHGVFVSALFNQGLQHARGIDLTTLPHVILSTPTLLIASLLMWLSHGWSFVGNFLMGTARDEPLNTIMMRPYGRMVVLHVTIIFGGFAVLALHSPVAPLVLLILIKTVIDLRLHLRANAGKGPVSSPAKTPAADPVAMLRQVPGPPHERPFEISGGGGIVPPPRGEAPPTK